MKRGVLAAMLLVLAGCGGGARMTAPAPVPTSNELAVFTDRETGFSTSDVHDAQDQIVRFTTAGELVWVENSAHFPGYIADGVVITADRQCSGCYFLVRFGTVNGEKRAYLTFSADDTAENPATVLDMDVIESQLTVTVTGRRIPRT